MEENGLGEFFDGWFATLEKGLEKLSIDECSRLFSECAKTCSMYVVSSMYRPLFDECEGNLDKFFESIHRIDNVEGRVIEPGRVYELIFKKCECPVHTVAKVTSSRLCVCSKESMICVFRALIPDREFKIEQISTILDGSNECKHVITFLSGNGQEYVDEDTELLADESLDDVSGGKSKASEVGPAAGSYTGSAADDNYALATA